MKTYRISYVKENAVTHRCFDKLHTVEYQAENEEAAREQFVQQFFQKPDYSYWTGFFRSIEQVA